jgi:hypothetical protein
LPEPGLDADGAVCALATEAEQRSTSSTAEMQRAIATPRVLLCPKIAAAFIFSAKRISPPWPEKIAKRFRLLNKLNT